MSFHVGQIVECIDDAGAVGRAGMRKGSRYTIAGHHAWPPGLYFSIAGFDGWWRKRRFRPIVERETSIEVFRKLLNPSPTKVTEDA